MEYDITLAKEAYELASRWDAARTVEDPSRLSFEESDLEKLDSNQISQFLPYSLDLLNSTLCCIKWPSSSD
jgi:leukotriene-A4 hydrolase